MGPQRTGLPRPRGFRGHQRAGSPGVRTASWPAGETALGTFVKLPTPEVIEVLALTGLDFLVIDNEHAAINPQTVSTMIGVARACGIAPFVRVPGHEPRDVQVFLDAGAAAWCFRTWTTPGRPGTRSRPAASRPWAHAA
ncbi:hypothetical protein GCM10020295_80320 [Streptomyces cinereospinus]